jgi:hypothetical protein
MLSFAEMLYAFIGMRPLLTRLTSLICVLYNLYAQENKELCAKEKAASFEAAFLVLSV